MKFSHSSKMRYALANVVASGLLVAVVAVSSTFNQPVRAAVDAVPNATQPAVAAAKPKPVPSPSPAFKHLHIVTTEFWVGEPGDGDNGDIPNRASAWDEHWMAHYGGVDTPNHRKGYWPAAFKPKENPFYFALPYSDYTDSGVRRATATNCANYSQRQALGLAHYSWCKNTWIAIRFNGKVAYAQWEDTGPYLENDTSYVFGAAQPHNTTDPGAGLDTSPAVQQYLKLNGLNRADWTFVPANKVPTGPWKQIVTTSKGDGN